MTERSSVQKPLLRYAGQIGWNYVTPPEAIRLRSSESSLYTSLPSWPANCRGSTPAWSMLAGPRRSCAI